MLNTRFVMLAGMVVLAVVMRLFPHPMNFTPIGAIALFAGATFRDKRAAVLVPLAALFLSDLFIGLHSLMWVVYGSFALAVGIGYWVRKNRSVARIAGGTLAGAILFYITTNFAVWVDLATYPKTAAGLAACYIAAIPFFRNSLAGDAVYATALFGGLALAERWWPVVRERIEPVHGTD